MTSSAYSRSPPTGSPLASRVTRKPERPEHPGEVGRGRLALEVGVGGQDHLGDRRRRPAGSSARGCAAGRGRCRRSARSRRRARGSGRGTRGCARSRRRPWAPRPRRARVGSRRGSRQIRHCSSSETLQQIVQNLTLRLDLDQHVGQPAYVDRVGLQQVERDPLRALGTDARAAGRARRSGPGRRLRTTGPPSSPSCPGSPAAAEAAGQRAERLGGQRVGLGLGVAVGRHDHVAEVGEVVGVVAVEAAGADRRRRPARRRR